MIKQRASVYRLGRVQLRGDLCNFSHSFIPWGVIGDFCFRLSIYHQKLGRSGGIYYHGNLCCFSLKMTVQDPSGDVDTRSGWHRHIRSLAKYFSRQQHVDPFPISMFVSIPSSHRPFMFVSIPSSHHRLLFLHPTIAFISVHLPYILAIYQKYRHLLLEHHIRLSEQHH